MDLWNPSLEENKKSLGSPRSRSVLLPDVGYVPVLLPEILSRLSCDKFLLQLAKVTGQRALAVETKTVLNSAMFATKRSAPDQEHSDGTIRSSKRLKPSPVATPITPVTSFLQRLVAEVLEDIENIPENLIILGLDRVLDRAVNDDFLTMPNVHGLVMRTIDSQITVLTEAREKGEIEVKYATLVEVVVIGLESMLKHISIVRYDSRLPHRTQGVAFSGSCTYAATFCFWETLERGSGGSRCNFVPSA